MNIALAYHANSLGLKEQPLLLMFCCLCVICGRGVESVNCKVDTRAREVFTTIHKPLEC